MKEKQLGPKQFIYGLFNDTANSTDYIALDEKMIDG
jgi:hypothetical protein